MSIPSPLSFSISPAELEARLRLHLLPELGPRRFRKLLSAFDSASAALTAPASAWRALGLPAICAEQRRSESIREQARAALQWLDEPDQQVLMWDDPAYPAPACRVGGCAAAAVRRWRSRCAGGTATGPGRQSARFAARSG